MLRVGLDASVLAIAKRATGIHRYTANLVRELARLCETEGLHLSLYFSRRVAPASVTPGHPLHDVRSRTNVRWRMASFPRGWQRVGMGLAMRVDRLDLFHFTSPLVARYCPVPMVVTVHDVAALSVPTASGDAERRALPDLRASASRARAIVAVSRSAAEEVRRHLHAEPVVVHEGVDGARFQPSRRDRGASSSLVGDAPYVLCVGTLYARKNHLRLLQAWEAVQRDVPHTLALAGDEGPASDAVAEFLAARPHLRVKRLGYVAEALMPALYAGADAVSLVSLWEGFGLPALEAMASGAPVIASNTPSLAEVADDAALLVDPCRGDEIAAGLRRILTDAALRERLRDAGLVRAGRFTWGKTARETLAVYRRVVLAR